MTTQEKITLQLHHIFHGGDRVSNKKLKETIQAIYNQFGWTSLKAKGKRIAVVSNKFDAATKALCDKYFPNLIDIALGENEAEGIRKKPAPDMVFKAMKQLNASPEECVYIGDSDVDLQTAKNSGIPCISVLWGFRNKEFLQAHGATIFVEKPEEIVKLNEK